MNNMTGRTNYTALPPNLRAAVFAALAALVGSLVLRRLLPEHKPAQDYAAGAALFSGMPPLRARLSGHERDLPEALGKCANCHAGPGRNPVDGPWPELRQGALQVVRSRRGGPAFRYDEASFCTTLRSGVDPAYVVLRRAMPRFTITDAQCRALWHFLNDQQRLAGDT